MFQPRQPTELQLKTVEPIDAFGAFLYAMHSLKTPDYLVLQHTLPAPEFSLHIAGLRTFNLDETLHFIAMMHKSCRNLGQNHRSTELAFSDDGMRMACLDHLELNLSQPLTLPFGLAPHPITGESFQGISLAHYVRLVDYDGARKIAEWRISTQLSDFFELLD